MTKAEKNPNDEGRNPKGPSEPSHHPRANGQTPEAPFSANEVRLDGRQWLIVLVVVGLVAVVTPRVWGRFERFDTGRDYRVPYELSKDYWLYGRWMGRAASDDNIIVLGDSVVWGEYVAPEGTLSHFLSQEIGTNVFINGGVNGLFPLAQEGLVRYYSHSIRNRKVILHCNLLWMTSPKADLSTTKEEAFNHSRLVPQFLPRVPCYRADANERLSAIIERQLGFVAWVSHLQDAYFGQQSIPTWTLDEENGDPNHCPNVYRNPLMQIRLAVPGGLQDDPQRGPKSPRHKPWSEDGEGTTRFEWVNLDSSLQWQAFQRVVEILRGRGNEVLVVVGPFNEHIMAKENRPEYLNLRAGIATWLRREHVPSVVPDTLPSRLYADASHPLTAGYELLARSISEDPNFRDWLHGR